MWISICITWLFAISSINAEEKRSEGDASPHFYYGVCKGTKSKGGYVTGLFELLNEWTY